MARLARRARSKGAQVVWVNADGYSKEGQVGKYLAELEASSLARHYLLNMDLDADAVAGRFDSEWRGVLPATFAYGPGDKGKHRVLGPTSSKEEARLLKALTATPFKE